MRDLEVVVEFTRGVMDRIRDFCEIERVERSWFQKDEEWILSNGFFTVWLRPERMIHFGDGFRIYITPDALNPEKRDPLEWLANLDMAKDTAEGYFLACCRGVYPIR